MNLQAHTQASPHIGSSFEDPSLVELDESLEEGKMMAHAVAEGIRDRDLGGLDPVEAAASLADFFSTFMIYSAPPEYIENFKRQYTMWVGAAFKLAGLSRLVEGMTAIDVFERHPKLAWVVCGGAAVLGGVLLWPTKDRIVAMEQAKLQQKAIQEELERRARAQAEAAAAGALAAEEGDPDGSFEVHDQIG